jgi:hypothetical protein
MLNMVSDNGNDLSDEGPLDDEEAKSAIENMPLFERMSYHNETNAHVSTMVS